MGQRWNYDEGNEPDTARVMAPGTRTANAIPMIDAGRSIDFRFRLEDIRSRIDDQTNNPANWTCQINVKQFTHSANELTRTIPLDEYEEWTGFLTPAETAALTGRGIYRIIAVLTSGTTGEVEQIVTRFQLNEPWL